MSVAVPDGMEDQWAQARPSSTASGSLRARRMRRRLGASESRARHPQRPRRRRFGGHRGRFTRTGRSCGRCWPPPAATRRRLTPPKEPCPPDQRTRQVPLSEEVAARRRKGDDVRGATSAGEGRRCGADGETGSVVCGGGVEPGDWCRVERQSDRRWWTPRWSHDWQPGGPMTVAKLPIRWSHAHGRRHLIERTSSGASPWTSPPTRTPAGLLGSAACTSTPASGQTQ
jgi:hypothetical protein